jgi:hypothetical protein
MKIKRVNLPNFINAFFTPLTPNTVWVNKKKHHVEHLVEHEVCHWEQKERYGLFLYIWIKTGSNILQFFGIRSGIEQEAYARQDKKELEMKGI